ncbi:MAG TPA: class I SAM-dependent methyltransferase [Thermoplasmata archaeon]|nr:class I SAM-dependent methyltransferase [Thermoplasmata archaeon]
MPEDHWTTRLFLDHDEIFLRIHEHGWEAGAGQAQDLKALFDRFGVPTGGRILDVPCGIGRHSTRLAKMGYRTLGVDLSPAYVRRAQELAEREGVADRAIYRVGDMRDLVRSVAPEERPFDAAINLWTSLGYYGEDADAAILRGYADLVRPGGLFVLFIVNRDWVVRHFDPQGWEEFGDLVHIEDRHLDLDASWMRNRWRFFRKKDEDLEGIAAIGAEHRIYSLHELRSLFERGGWQVEATFGGLKMDDPSFDAPSLAIVGRK